MTENIDIIHSSLEQTYSADGHSVHIQIYRSSDSLWILEVVDEHGTSTVWDDPFDTDTAALEKALISIETEGINSQKLAKEVEPDFLKSLAQKRSPSLATR